MDASNPGVDIVEKYHTFEHEHICDECGRRWMRCGRELGNLTSDERKLVVKHVRTEERRRKAFVAARRRRLKQSAPAPEDNERYRPIPWDDVEQIIGTERLSQLQICQYILIEWTLIVGADLGEVLETCPTCP